MFEDIRSVAVIGASKDPQKPGYTILKSLVEAKISGEFRGRLYAVNPKEKEILGVECYPSILDIDDEVDMAIIAVAAQRVPQIVEECGRKKVKVVVIISGGFSEVGNAELEKKVVEIAKKYGIRVVGPNCAGISIAKLGIYASLEPRFPPGSIGLAAQSGAIGGLFISYAKKLGEGLSFFVSLGNRADVDEVDIVEYALRDDSTKSLALYIEGVKRGRRFVEVCREFTKVKPLAILKAGRTSAGSRAAASHTASLAGDYRVFEGVAKQVGAVLVDTIEELVAVCVALPKMKLAQGGRVCIVTNAGGPSVLLADYLEMHGLQVPELSQELRSKLSFLPPIASTRNPIDLTASFSVEDLEKVLKVLDESSECSYIAFVYVPVATASRDEVASLARKVVEVVKELRKPFIACLAGENVDKALVEMNRSSVAALDRLDLCAKALARHWEWSSRVARLSSLHRPR